MFDRKQSTNAVAWAVAAGAAAGAGAAAAAFGVLRNVRRRRLADEDVPVTAMDRLEDAVVEALRRDPQTGVCAIDVAALGPDMIELTGIVPTADVAQWAVRLLHRLPQVRTVISRVEVGSLETRLAENRERLARGEPQLLERRWYGVRVGTGRRRQSAATEPARPDDSLQRLSRQLEVHPGDLGDSASHQGVSGRDDAGQRPL
jgi:hypothetical protein